MPLLLRSLTMCGFGKGESQIQKCRIRWLGSQRGPSSGRGPKGRPFRAVSFSNLLHLSLLSISQIKISEESARHSVAASHPVCLLGAWVFRLCDRKRRCYGEGHYGS